MAKLFAHQRVTGILEAAIRTGLQILRVDPLQEAVSRAVIRLYLRLGRRGAALREHQRCVDTLRTELGIEPELETTQLYRAILATRPASQALRELDSAVRAPGRTAEGIAREAFSVDTPFIGRDVEQARARAALDAGWAGNSGVVLIRGESGVGKSRLLAELAAHAVQRGAAVLRARGRESVRARAFGVAWELLRSHPLTDGTIERLDPASRIELRQVLDGAGGSVEVGTATGVTRVLGLVTEVIAAAAARRPVMLALDDVQWADEESVALIVFLARRLKTSPVCPVVAVRDEELPVAPGLRELMNELGREHLLSVVSLTGLGAPDTARLVRALAPSDVDGRALARIESEICAASRGNPFVVIETMRALRDARSEGFDPPVTARRTITNLSGLRLE